MQNRGERTARLTSALDTGDGLDNHPLLCSSQDKSHRFAFKSGSLTLDTLVGIPKFHVFNPLRNVAIRRCAGVMRFANTREAGISPVIFTPLTRSLGRAVSS